MTKAILFEKESHFIGLEVKGHSGYANKGSDIVCAGISTAVCMSVNLLDKFIHGHFELIQNEAVGYICLKNLDYSSLTDIQVEIVTQIFNTLLETLRDIEANYQNHLKVKIENK
ncbi:MAG: ribosomal-processing cysteine protease Prp [Anaeroplasma bactoclasticum]|nr:ribosomal-processing cysteine protease Prp [Anaeroplasma bactoclasticum]